MIRLTDKIWVGNADDDKRADLITEKITAVLNVAHDLHGVRGFLDDVECAHIGLIDGPGNRTSAYCSAVLGLAFLLERHDRVMVFCHEDHSRSLAVVIMYTIMVTGRVGGGAGMMNRWMTWDAVLNDLRNKSGAVLLDPHEAHRAAADKIPYGLLEQLR